MKASLDAARETSTSLESTLSGESGGQETADIRIASETKPAIGGNDEVPVEPVRTGLVVGIAVALVVFGMVLRRWLLQTSSRSSVDAAPRPRSTLGQAWDEWWAQRDRWVTLLVQNVLGLVFAFCLIAYLGGHSKSELLPKEDGQFVRHTVAVNGMPFSPWFHFEMNPEGELGWHWEIHWISWSSAIMLFGFVAWWANWQVEKAKAKLTDNNLHWWDGSPNLGIAIWAVGTLLAILFGAVIPACT